jgi:DNA-binding MarR family transcriptional regulator
MTVATLALLLARLGRVNESFLVDFCRVHASNPSELRVLAVLRSREDSGPVSPTNISQWIVQTTGGLTATLRRLEEAGYIARVPDPDDGRGKLVELTPSGETFCDQVLDGMVERYSVALADIDTEASFGAVRDLLTALESFGGVGSSAAWNFEDAPLSSN